MKAHDLHCPTCGCCVRLELVATMHGIIRVPWCHACAQLMAIQQGFYCGRWH